MMELKRSTRNTIQHTAIHCNALKTLQHAATHCKTTNMEMCMMKKGSAHHSAWRHIPLSLLLLMPLLLLIHIAT